MAKIIEISKRATCYDCGADLPIGSRARCYRGGKVYGVDCHSVDWTAIKEAKRQRDNALLDVCKTLLVALDTGDQDLIDETHADIETRVLDLAPEFTGH